MTDLTARFEALVHQPEAAIALGHGALLIAGHAHPGIDLAARDAQLDDLASPLVAADASAVATALFSPGGFTGNTVDYYDPANSYLDAVLDRKLGIPITLSVLMIEVGARAGIALHGVGMPGHFLVGAGADEYFDPFHGSECLDAAACARLFSAVQRGATFRADYLAPVGPRAILDRMLSNLQQAFLAREPAAAAWPTRLRLTFPGLEPARRSEFGALLGSLGQFSEAASVFDALARELAGGAADEAARAAARLRARAN